MKRFPDPLYITACTLALFAVIVLSACGEEEPQQGTGNTQATSGPAINETQSAGSETSPETEAATNTDRTSQATGGPDIASGREHSCWLKSDGQVVCWGLNHAGQASPPGGRFSSISAMENLTCGVRIDGQVACWGVDEAGQASPPGGDFLSANAGELSACGILADGSVECWGENPITF
ncbi:MAG: RCC1 domain-containing protein [Chloroflexota bacterium]|nr:RCC1 domain-containing protein [Chloroflexota bacterium]